MEDFRNKTSTKTRVQRLAPVDENRFNILLIFNLSRLSINPHIRTPRQNQRTDPESTNRAGINARFRNQLSLSTKIKLPIPIICVNK
jgi:hypothetical protein